MKEKFITLMWGVPGSGKTTKANKYACDMDDEYVVSLISRDKIRENMCYPAENKSYKAFIAQIKQDLFDDNIAEIIIDQTNVFTNSRIKLYKALMEAVTPLSEHIQVEYVILDTPLDICIHRNRQRVGRACVPEDAIREMYKKKTYPTIQEIKMYWPIDKITFNYIGAIMNMGKMYLISENDLRKLIRNSLQYIALENGGVDNWICYGDSENNFIEIYADELKERGISVSDASFSDIVDIEINNYEEAM